MINNYFFTAAHNVLGLKVYNAAEGGLERGKAWIREKTLQDGQIPRWNCPNAYGLLRQSDLDSYQSAHPSGNAFDILLVRSTSGDLGQFSYSVNGISVSVHIFDMNYAPDGNISYKRGFPPRGNRLDTGSEQSMHQSSSYAGSNRSEGFSGSGTEGTGDESYLLIRSTASSRQRNRTVETVVVARK